jgi:hypothetical protein
VTLVELLTSLAAVPIEPSAPRVVDLEVSLPVEVSLRDDDLLIGAPRWRWRTDFDADPGRLRLLMAIEEVAS